MTMNARSPGIPLSRRALLAASAAAVVAGAPVRSRAAETVALTVAYQTTVEPSKVPQAAGAYEQASGAALSWRRFDSGADIIAALAAGAVQIGYVGSSPLAIAASRDLPILAFYVAGLIGDAEALVARTGSGISSPADLAGRRLAVPFVSTAHYSLLAALRHWSIPAAAVHILNLKPPEIAAAWQRGDIDAAYVWDPALGRIKQTGRVLATSADVGRWGAPTFDAWVVRRDFAAAHPDIVTAFARVTAAAYADYLDHPAAWGAASAPAAAIARLTGARAQDVPALLRSYTLPRLAEQGAPALLGGGITKAVADTAAFLRDQGGIPAIQPSYAPYVTPRFVTAAG